jgi:hypothetical protein
MLPGAPYLDEAILLNVSTTANDAVANNAALQHPVKNITIVLMTVLRTVMRQVLAGAGSQTQH